jgi:hypothetical protein
MDDEFTEFKSAESVSEVNLLDFSTNSDNYSKKNVTGSIFPSITSEVIQKPFGLKKKTFIFPLDLDISSSLILSPPKTNKPSAWSLMEDIEGLNTLSKDLVTNGRLGQGLKCKKHAETIGEMIRIKEIKRIAAEREDYDTAVQYRNLLAQLEKQLCTAEEIEEWLKDYKETTLYDLEAQVKKSMGDEIALEFKEKFVFPDIKKSSDIEAAQLIMLSAQHYIKVKSVLKDQTSVFFQQTHLILQKINEELSKAITILYKLKPHFPELTEDTELQTYIKALPEIYFIGTKLSKIISFCNFTKAFEKILCEIAHNWDECKGIIKANAIEIKTEIGDNICGLCYFFGKSLVILGGSFFHVGCINFWINRVSTEPPKSIKAII